MKRDFCITDMRSVFIAEDRSGKRSMDYAECWLDTPYVCDGYPVTAWAFVNVLNPDFVDVSELYVTRVKNPQFRVLTEAAYDHSTHVQNLDFYTGPKYLVDEDGHGVTMADCHAKVREFVRSERGKAHVMSYEEYRDWRACRKDRYGAMKDEDYQQYLDAVEKDMLAGKKFVGRVRKCSDLYVFRETDPVWQREMADVFSENEETMPFDV